MRQNTDGSKKITRIATKIDTDKANKLWSSSKDEGILQFLWTGTSLSVTANLLAILVAVLGGVTWLNIKIDRIITETIKPYEELLEGWSLASGENYEEAIISFENAFSTLDKNSSETKLIAIIDPYLVPSHP